ncbi:hypothetical protein Ccrd_020091 [Cynara cardunculus var. scolymus]|uniref:glutathione transferase n=1 Tax=Cynara cardunculus var. scolymus TaxID=59895 RepID=A0A118K0Q2_CYNCS|nr:hypothetical protein Ccrd_020091 [Cynara cardunculus var. scolymus]
MTTSSGQEESKKLQLYSYYRSSCSFRVRIALNLKGLDYEYKAVNLLKGEQHSPEFVKVNPIGYVPALVDGDILVSDSFAIVMYLEEKYPQHPLLPRDLEKRAINYQAANIVSASIQPLQNLDVLKYIEEKVGPDAKIPWVQKHIGKGFAGRHSGSEVSSKVALEKLLQNHAGKYATGDDVFLVLRLLKFHWEFNAIEDFVLSLVRNGKSAGKKGSVFVVGNNMVRRTSFQKASSWCYYWGRMRMTKALAICVIWKSRTNRPNSGEEQILSGMCAALEFFGVSTRVTPDGNWTCFNSILYSPLLPSLNLSVGGFTGLRNGRWKVLNIEVKADVFLAPQIHGSIHSFIACIIFKKSWEALLNRKDDAPIQCLKV